MSERVKKGFAVALAILLLTSAFFSREIREVYWVFRVDNLGGNEDSREALDRMANCGSRRSVDYLVGRVLRDESERVKKIGGTIYPTTSGISDRRYVVVTPVIYALLRVSERHPIYAEEKLRGANAGAKPETAFRLSGVLLEIERDAPVEVKVEEPAPLP